MSRGRYAVELHLCNDSSSVAQKVQVAVLSIVAVILASSGDTNFLRSALKTLQRDEVEVLLAVLDQLLHWSLGVGRQVSCCARMREITKWR